MNWETIALFFIYTLITVLVSIVNRRNAETKGEEVKNEAVSTVNSIATEALDDARQTREALKEVREALQAEREKRAFVEGQVEQITSQATEAKKHADQARIKMAQQDEQITKIYNQLQLITDEFDNLKLRLVKVTAERDQLISEKTDLTLKLNAKGTAYDDLMASVQTRIDQAVSDVRQELKQHYQEKISKLEAQIKAKDKEIAKLKLQISEETHAQAQTSTNPTTDNNPTVLPTADPSPRSDTGPTTNNPSQPSSGSNSAGNSGDNTSPNNAHN